MPGEDRHSHVRVRPGRTPRRRRARCPAPRSRPRPSDRRPCAAGPARPRGGRGPRRRRARPPTRPANTRTCGRSARFSAPSSAAGRYDSTAMTDPDGPTCSASTAANSPAPAYRSHAESPASRPDQPATTSAYRSAASGWACQNQFGSHPPLPAHGPLDGDPAGEPVDRDVRVRGRRPTGDRQLGARRPRAADDRVHGARRGDRTVVDRHDPMAAVRAEPRPAVVVDGEPGPGPPVQRTARQLLDLDVHLEVSQPPQLLGDHRRLQRALAGRRRVLPVAAAAAAGHRDRARRLDPLRRGDQHRHRVAAAERAAPVLGHRDDHPLAGQRVPHEHHAALVPRDAVAAVRDRPDLDLEPPDRPTMRSPFAVLLVGEPSADRTRRQLLAVSVPMAQPVGRTPAATARWSPSRPAGTAAGP